MKKALLGILKYALLPTAGLLLTGTVALVGIRFVAQRQTAGRIRMTAPNGIHTIEKIQLGGIEQWIQIRGEDRRKPILLFLHGGPGFPQMTFAHLNAELEKHFVVVQWDHAALGNLTRGRSGMTRCGSNSS